MFVSEPCIGGQYLDQDKGCIDCEAGSYSAGGTVNSCTKCEINRYSSAGASKCIDCPANKEVASGDGKQEGDCTWSELNLQADFLA